MWLTPKIFLVFFVHSHLGCPSFQFNLQWRADIKLKAAETAIKQASKHYLDIVDTHHHKKILSELINSKETRLM